MLFIMNINKEKPNFICNILHLLIIEHKYVQFEDMKRIFVPIATAAEIRY